MASVALPGSERPRPAESRLVRPLAADEIVTVILLVRPPPGSPPLPDFADWQRTPPGRRRFLSVEEYVETYGSSEADIQAVTDFARAHALAVLESNAGRGNVIVRGAAAQINQAFEVTLNWYESPLPGPASRTQQPPRRTMRAARQVGADAPEQAMQIHRGFDGPAHLPEELVGVVTAVVGLDRRRSGSHNGTGDPQDAFSLSVPTLAQLYNFPNTGAANQTIGVFSGGGSYLSTDIKDSYFPSLPAGYTTPPNLVDVDLTYTESGSSETFSNNPGEISSGNAQNGDYELTQDICTSSTIAQGATVNVYFTDDSEPGWVAFLKRLLVPGTETQPSVVTSSWFFDRQDDTAGDPTQTGTVANTLSGLFKAIAAQGITFLIAAGDWGCDDAIVDGQCHVQYPPSDQWVTSCGGTIIGSVQGSTFDEVVWSDTYSASPFGSSGDWGATGGGVSATFAVPPYQTAAGVAQASNNDNQVRRGLPDVAGMVALSGFYMNGSLYPGGGFYTGTSCVAPLYCGLIAVINSATGTRTGLLNQIIYPLGETVVRTDVTTGNNDSGDTPTPPETPAKPYSAGPGWDACTGWGSLDGTKLLNGVVQSLFTQDMQFWVDDSTFGADEVQDTPDYANAFWLVLDGFTPNVLGISESNLSGTVAPVLSGPFLTLLGSANIYSAGPPVLELADSFYTPQRIRYPYDLKFPQGVSFPATGEQFYTLSARITVPGNPTPFTAETDFELTAGANPYFTNVDPQQDNVYWLSQDLRTFTITPETDNTKPIGDVPFTFQGGSPTQLDTAAAYSYIQQLVGYFNTTYSDPGGIDPFSPSNPIFPSGESGGVYQGDSSVTPTTPNPADPSQPFQNYNFALARVRLRGPSGAAGEASAVKVFFRLFSTQTNDTDYVNTAQAVSLADPFVTYPSNPPNAPDDPASPLPGTDANGNINGCTIPFFADPNQIDLQPATPANPDPPYGVNNRDITIPQDSDYIWTYFGCFLNVYDPNNIVGGQDVQGWLANGSHHCLVAQIAYSAAPIENANNVIENPENSDKLAQRNLQVTPSGNPGFPATHRVPQTFDVRPSPSKLPGSPGAPGNQPDELMIDWGATPTGTVASVFWPQVDASDVLQLADSLYATHLLSAADAHTVQITCAGGAGYLPIPFGTGPNLAGLLTFQLPSGIRLGEEFQIVVRRITSRLLPDDRVPEAAADPTVQTTPVARWRYVVGTFQISVPVLEDSTILPIDSNLLAILKWRLSIVGRTNRWYPVLERWIVYIEGRIRGMGGDPGKIPPSRFGTGGQPIPPGEGWPTRDGIREIDGKVTGLVYDRFGDFEGFLLLSERGHESRFRCHEHRMEELLHQAWADRDLISVLVERREPDYPLSIVLRRR